MAKRGHRHRVHNGMTGPPIEPPARKGKRSPRKGGRTGPVRGGSR